MEHRRAERKSVRWTVLAAVLLLCFALLVGYGDDLLPKQEPVFSGDCVRVHFLDVGQGSSVLIQSGSEGILIDAGERACADRVIACLNTCGVKTLRLAVATHPHSDHVGALPEVLQAVPTETLLVPRLTEANMPASYAYESLLNTVRALLALPFESVLCPHSAAIHARAELEAFLDGLSDGALAAAPASDTGAPYGVGTREVRLPREMVFVFDGAKA